MNYWFSNHMASKLGKKLNNASEDSECKAFAFCIGIIIFGLLAFCLTILFTQ